MAAKMGGGTSRRAVLWGAGGLAAAVPLGSLARAAPGATDVTGRLARYMVSARDAALPAEVSTAYKAAASARSAP